MPRLFEIPEMMRDNDNEMLPLVDAEGRVIGKASRGECHSGSFLLHPVVHLHLVDKEGKLYLQKRPLWKSIQPGKWDTGVGGHIDFGETVEEALLREVGEEIGITAIDAALIRVYEFQSNVERELVNVFLGTSLQKPVPSGELDGGRFFSLDEIDAMIGKGLLTPNFEREYESIVRPEISQQ